MAWTQTLQDCSEYLDPSRHPQGNAWAALSNGDQQMWFDRALIVLEATQGRTMNAPGGTTNTVQRAARAVFEQARWMSVNVPVSGPGGLSSPRSVDEDAADMTMAVSPAALAFMRKNRIMIDRG